MKGAEIKAGTVCVVLMAEPCGHWKGRTVTALTAPQKLSGSYVTTGRVVDCLVVPFTAPWIPDGKCVGLEPKYLLPISDPDADLVHDLPPTAPETVEERARFLIAQGLIPKDPPPKEWGPAWTKARKGWPW